MTTAIIYYSKHHGNTKKLVDAIKEAHPEIKTIDITENRKLKTSKPIRQDRDSFRNIRQQVCIRTYGIS